MTAEIIPFTTTPPQQQATNLDGLATPSAILSAEQNPGNERPCPGNLFNIHSRSLLALPFVTLPSETCEDWGEFWKRTTMWNDEPTDCGYVDFSRGRRYAREAVAAIISDGAHWRDLELVVDAILHRGFSRRGPGGRLCRQLSTAETAFLHELCRIAIEVKQEVTS
jgi:hypothetical protein